MCKTPQTSAKNCGNERQLYLLNFKADGIIKDPKPSEGGDKGDEDGEGSDEDLDSNDLLEEDLGGERDQIAPTRDGNDDNGQNTTSSGKPGDSISSGGNSKSSVNPAGSQKGSAEKCLKRDQVAAVEGLSSCSNQIPKCINLLQAMESWKDKS